MTASMLNPVIKSALAGLPLDLEEELKRYESKGLPSPPDLINRDFTEANRSSIVEDAQDIDLSFLDDYASESATDLENSFEAELEEEFQNQLLTPEYSKISTSKDLQNQEPELQEVPKTEATEPNLLSPLGIISMIVLLAASATVGYLWVDPSGLNRLIKPDSNAKPTSALPNSLSTLELFQPKPTNSQTPNTTSQIPFTDFSAKPQQVSSQVLRPLLPAINTFTPTALGRSFEPPIRVEPVEKIEVKTTTKVEKPNPENSNQNLANESPVNSRQQYSQLEITSDFEVIPDPSLNLPPASKN